MIFDQQGVFELSWKNSDTTRMSTTDEQSYFTVFWCANIKQGHPNHCDVRKLV